jgi:hypothetical protein
MPGNRMHGRFLKISSSNCFDLFVAFEHHMFYRRLM